MRMRLTYGRLLRPSHELIGPTQGVPNHTRRVECHGIVRTRSLDQPLRPQRLDLAEEGPTTVLRGERLVDARGDAADAATILHLAEDATGDR